MKLQTALFLLLLFLSCKSDPLIDYETAAKNCPMDTMRFTTAKGQGVGYSMNFEGLIGAQLPEFSAKTMDGKEINKSYFKGKISIINFWFIGCHPCEDEMPVFNQLVEKYKDKPVQFLALSRNSPTDIDTFLLEHPFNVDHIAYAEPLIVDTFHGRWGYPITMVADQNMKILFITRGLGNANPESESQKEFVQVIDKALAVK